MAGVVFFGPLGLPGWSVGKQVASPFASKAADIYLVAHRSLRTLEHYVVVLGICGGLLRAFRYDVFR